MEEEQLDYTISDDEGGAPHDASRSPSRSPTRSRSPSRSPSPRPDPYEGVEQPSTGSHLQREGTADANGGAAAALNLEEWQARAGWLLHNNGVAQA